MRTRPRAALAALALAAASYGAVGAQTSTLPLATPPAANNPAASSIFDAMLAISRATATNPSAAQAASFAYQAAIQRYQAGDRAAARQNALQAISLAGQLPPAQPGIGTAPGTTVLGPQRAATIGAPPPITPLAPATDPAQADAEAFLAVARRALATCGAAPGARAGLQQQYAAAVAANAARRWNDVRTSARGVIAGCAVPATGAGS